MAVRSKLNIIQQELLCTAAATAVPLATAAKTSFVASLLGNSTTASAKFAPLQQQLFQHHANAMQQHPHRAPALTAATSNVTSSSAQYFRSVDAPLHYSSSSSSSTLQTARQYGSAVSHEDMSKATAAPSVHPVTALSQRDIVLNTVPFYKIISHCMRQSSTLHACSSHDITSSAFRIRTNSIFSERLDWMLDNLYNPLQQFSTAHNENKSISGRVTSVGAAREQEDLNQSRTHNISPELEDVISDFD